MTCTKEDTVFVCVCVCVCVKYKWGRCMTSKHERGHHVCVCVKYKGESCVKNMKRGRQWLYFLVFFFKVLFIYNSAFVLYFEQQKFNRSRIRLYFCFWLHKISKTTTTHGVRQYRFRFGSDRQTQVRIFYIWNSDSDSDSDSFRFRSVTVTVTVFLFCYERAYFTYKDVPQSMTAILPGWDRKWCPHPVEIITHSWAERPRYYSVILSQSTLNSERASVQCAVLGCRGVHAACQVFLANDYPPCLHILSHRARSRSR